MDPTIRTETLMIKFPKHPNEWGAHRDWEDLRKIFLVDIFIVIEIKF